MMWKVRLEEISQILPSEKGKILSRPGSPGFQEILAERLAQGKTTPKEALTLAAMGRYAALCGLSDGEDPADPAPQSPLSLSLRAALERLIQGAARFLDAARGVSTGDHRRQSFDDIIEDAAMRQGLDPALIRAVIQAESGGDPCAVSPAGAQGLMQLMPETARELGVTDPLDPEQNIQAGARYLRMLLDRYGGDVRLALEAYNRGMGNLERDPGGTPAETRLYIARIERLLGRNSGFSQSV
jgi:soluble lytic murein transglycosylase-like protein